MSDPESYLLLVLADSALPTGAFVASAGLESYLSHGFLEDVVTFTRHSLETYARSALPFVTDAYDALVNNDVDRVAALDELYETMTVNHVTRRASKAQGAAMLTLYTKGFATPGSASKAVEKIKLNVRKENQPGHLPVCWSVLTASLGLSLEKTQYLFLFLFARSILSAAVRLNVIGPYKSHQVLVHDVKPMVDLEVARSKDLRTNMNANGDIDEDADGPMNTWPLGDLIAARHDMLHSRIFNS